MCWQSNEKHKNSQFKNSKNAVSDANDNLSWIFKNISS